MVRSRRLRLFVSAERGGILRAIEEVRMQATIEVVTGILVGRRFDVADGAPAVFGRSEDSTVCLSFDPEVAQTHFSVECTGAGCVVRALSEIASTLVNGESIGERTLEVGDRITAGKTSFVVARIHEPYAAVRPAPVAAGAAAASAVPAPSATTPPEPEEEERKGPELLAWLSLEDEEVVAIAKPDQPAADLAEALRKKKQYQAALRVEGHRLGPRNAVWWGVMSLDGLFGDDVPEDEVLPLEAARAWVAEPTEENRRTAGDAAAEVKHAGLACWPAQAAFWSGGSLAPEGLPEVPPDARLTGQGVTAALLMAAAHGAPAGAKGRYERFLALAKDVAEGKHPYPEPEPATST
jgi:Family of unknown function (DUF6931)/Inner membrane component of T3SS, cytoplasmic domain